MAAKTTKDFVKDNVDKIDKVNNVDDSLITFESLNKENRVTLEDLKKYKENRANSGNLKTLEDIKKYNEN